MVPQILNHARALQHAPQLINDAKEEELLRARGKAPPRTVDDALFEQRLAALDVVRTGDAILAQQRPLVSHSIRVSLEARARTALREACAFFAPNHCLSECA